MSCDGVLNARENSVDDVHLAFRKLAALLASDDAVLCSQLSLLVCSLYAHFNYLAYTGHDNTCKKDSLPHQQMPAAHWQHGLKLQQPAMIIRDTASSYQRSSALTYGYDMSLQGT